MNLLILIIVMASARYRCTACIPTWLDLGRFLGIYHVLYYRYISQLSYKLLFFAFFFSIYLAKVMPCSQVPKE